MVPAYLLGGITKFHAYPSINAFNDAPLCKIANFNTLNNTASTTASLLHGPSSNVVHSTVLPWSRRCQLKTHHLSQRVASNIWLCRSRDPISPDDEYRSSRNIAISLFRRYRNLIDRGGGDNLKEFIRAGVNAYALGCTDEGLRKELNAMKESGFEIEAMQGCGGSTSLKSKILAQEVDECILWLSIIFITILCTPQPTIVRWSSTPSVSDKILHQWKGFCAVIANAYFIRGMAWLPVKTLQLEQMAVTGRAEEPSVVASRMRLVFSTLEHIYGMYIEGKLRVLQHLEQLWNVAELRSVFLSRQYTANAVSAVPPNCRQNVIPALREKGPSLKSTKSYNLR